LSSYRLFLTAAHWLALGSPSTITDFPLESVHLCQDILLFTAATAVSTRRI